jgi:hypothetical protein
MSSSQKQEELDTIWHRLTLPEEDRDPWMRHCTHRWFRSSNVMDLWPYRNSEEKARIRAALDGGKI